MESARPARAEDLDRVAQLAAEAIAELAVEKGGVVWRRREARAEPVGPGLAAALDDPDHHVVAGCIGDAVMGYGVVRAERLRDGDLLGVVTDLYVEPGARGIGLGEAVMDALIAWCEGRGCVGVDSVALPGMRATKNFFERFGLVARAIVVHRPLGTTGEDG
ncbi:MAG TPA: GNAT family N-acetyltransferase [Acidimicrobiales bacterium]